MYYYSQRSSFYVSAHHRAFLSRLWPSALKETHPRPHYSLDLCVTVSGMWLIKSFPLLLCEHEPMWAACICLLRPEHSDSCQCAIQTQKPDPGLSFGFPLRRRPPQQLSSAHLILEMAKLSSVSSSDKQGLNLYLPEVLEGIWICRLTWVERCLHICSSWIFVQPGMQNSWHSKEE